MAEEKTQKSATTVTIACKHPPGLILRLFKMTPVQVPVLGGGVRTEQRADPIPGKEIRINGPQKPFGEEPKCIVVAGYALTSGVPKDDWEEWKRQNHDSDLLKNRLLFAYTTLEAASAEAKNAGAKTRSGLEPLNMSMKSVPGPQGPRMVPADERVPRAPGLTIQKEGTDAAA